VLAHTAGLPLHYQFFYADRPDPAPAMADTIARYGILVTPPGEHYQYSNVGFGILGHAVSVTAGEALEDALRSLVFEPLAMTQSGLNPRPGFTPAAAVRYGPGHRPIPPYTTDHPGASEVYASARDLIRFGMFHLGFDPAGARPVLSPDARAQMQTAATPAGVDPAYGMGWFVTDEFGFRKVYHTGSMPGVSTMLALYPEDDVAVVVLLNSLDREQRVEIAREIAGVVIPGFAEARARRSPGGGASAASEELGDRLWSGTLRTWSGPLAFELRVSRGRVFARIGRNEELLVRNARLSNERLTGRVAASIDTPDLARAARYDLMLDLRREGDRLAGAVTAASMGEPTLFNLTSYAELRAAGGQ
jgi:CubicO group peptidase (beta-lactamase class C family)